MIEPWRIRLLGDLSAFQGEHAVTRFRTQKTGALLAYLALYGGRAHPRDTLLDVLWPDSDLSAARNSLGVALNSLRRQLEPPSTPGTASIGAVLIADRATVRLRPEAFRTDVAAFEAARDEAAGAETDTAAIEALARAEGIYSGELLPGFYDDWVLSERERLADARLQGLRRLTALLTQARDFDRALEYAHRAVQADPLSEEARRLLMRLYASIGRPAAVREQFEELERLLEAEGDGPPSEATRELAVRLEEGTNKDAEGASVIRAILPASPSTRVSTKIAGAQTVVARGAGSGQGFPLRFTRFFGRDDEILRIRALLTEGTTRLLTLTGGGGAGKTRLAVEAAAQLGGAFTGGVCFVPLADVGEPGRVFDAIRDALRLPRSPAATEPLLQIVAALSASGPSLLVLDNLEHLLGHGPLDSSGAATMIQILLDRVPSLALLATSRRLLRVAGEQELPVLPLPTPPDQEQSPDQMLQYASVRLFVDRAQTRRVDFQITPRNAASIARLCNRLEGVPLALELAAAWAKLFTPAQMLDRLSHGFAQMESTRPEVPARHRSLRAAVEWSYGLLSPEEQRLFARLSVFRGGWAVEAAAPVCNALEDMSSAAGRTLECLSRLQDASLLIAAEAPAGTGQEMRLRLPEPLREFAQEQIADNEREALEDRHAHYFLERAEEAGKYLQGPEQHVWFDRLEADHDNFRSVLDRHVGDEIGVRLAGTLARFWKTRGYFREGKDWLDRVLSTGAVAPTAARARALNGAGMMAYDLADLDAARALYEESLRLQRMLGDDLAAAGALTNLGNVAYRNGDYLAAGTLYREALALYRAKDNAWGMASALGSLGNVADMEGDYAAARTLHEESLSLSREIGDARMTAYTLHNLGNLALREGKPGHARVLYQESLPMKEALGDRRGVAALQNSLGFLAAEEGDLIAAMAYFTEALRTALDIGDRIGILNGIDGMAWIAADQDKHAHAICLFGAVAAARETLKVPYTPEQEDVFGNLIAGARNAAPPGVFEKAWEEGRTLPLETAARVALA